MYMEGFRMEMRYFLSVASIHEEFNEIREFNVHDNIGVSVPTRKVIGIFDSEDSAVSYLYNHSEDVVQMTKFPVAFISYASSGCFGNCDDIIHSYVYNTKLKRYAIDNTFYDELTDDRDIRASGSFGVLRDEY